METRKIILTRGIQGSGKSTWAKQWAEEDPEHRVRFNNDDIRNMLGKYWVPKREPLVTDMKKQFLNYTMSHNYDIVIDNMNLNPKEVDFFREVIKEHNSWIGHPECLKTLQEYILEFKDFKTPYSFFNTYGVSHKKYLAGRMIETYSKCKTIEIEKLLKPYIVKLTYKDAGFTYQNYDEIFLIESKYKELEKKVRIQCVLDKNILETTSSVNQCLHQLCGGWFRGTLYIQEKLLWLKKYISKSKGKTAIMAYFIEEQEELSKIFKDCTILSSTKYCEGIDLSHYDNFILYSFGYSGSKFIQLRDRIVNLTKDKPTKVIIPLLKDGVDKNIYEVVSKKKNFNLKSFSKEEDA